MRACSFGTCALPAAFIGRYTNQLQEAKTKAACSTEHLHHLTLELQHEGFNPVWREFNQPEDLRRGLKTLQQYTNGAVDHA